MNIYNTICCFSCIIFNLNNTCICFFSKCLSIKIFNTSTTTNTIITFYTDLNGLSSRIRPLIPLIFSSLSSNLLTLWWNCIFIKRICNSNFITTSTIISFYFYFNIGLLSIFPNSVKLLLISIVSCPPALIEPELNNSFVLVLSPEI